MTFEVKNRSVESWGALADVDESTFNKIINDSGCHTKHLIASHLKMKKKLKKYRIAFIKNSQSEYFEVEATDDYNVTNVAFEFFKKNIDKISFKERERSKWADGYKGYDQLSYSKIR